MLNPLGDVPESEEPFPVAEIPAGEGATGITLFGEAGCDPDWGAAPGNPAVNSKNIITIVSTEGRNAFSFILFLFNSIISSICIWRSSKIPKSDLVERICNCIRSDLSEEIGKGHG